MNYALSQSVRNKGWRQDGGAGRFKRVQVAVGGVAGSWRKGACETYYLKLGHLTGLQDLKIVPPTQESQLHLLPLRCLLQLCL
jgi:hypothetical protein